MTTYFGPLDKQSCIYFLLTLTINNKILCNFIINNIAFNSQNIIISNETTKNHRKIQYNYYQNFFTYIQL
jgi:hypothetical protein